MSEQTQKEGGISIDHIRNCNVCNRNSWLCPVWHKPVPPAKTLSETAGKSAGGSEGEGIIKRKDELIIRKK